MPLAVPGTDAFDGRIERASVHGLMGRTRRASFVSHFELLVWSGSGHELMPVQSGDMAVRIGCREASRASPVLFMAADLSVPRMDGSTVTAQRRPVDSLGEWCTSNREVERAEATQELGSTARHCRGLRAQALRNSRLKPQRGCSATADRRISGGSRHDRSPRTSTAAPALSRCATGPSASVTSGLWCSVDGRPHDLSRGAGQTDRPATSRATRALATVKSTPATGEARDEHCRSWRVLSGRR